MKTFEVGDIVIVKENSLQVTENTMGYIFHVYSDLPPKNDGLFTDNNMRQYAHIITETGEVLRGVSAESLVHVTKSHYIYIWKQNEQGLRQWIATNVFKNILDSVGTQTNEIDEFIINKHRTGWWNIH